MDRLSGAPGLSAVLLAALVMLLSLSCGPGNEDAQYTRVPYSGPTSVASPIVQAPAPPARSTPAPIAQEQVRPTPATWGVVVALDPASRTISVGDLFALEVVVNAGSQEVDVVDACVNFDRSVLRVVDPSNGAEMPDGNDARGVALVANTAAMDTVLARQVVNSRGQVNCSAARLNGPPPSGSFRLATVHFKAIAPSAGSPVTFNTTAPRFTLAARAGEQVGGGGSGSTIVVGAAVTSTSGAPPAGTPAP